MSISGLTYVPDYLDRPTHDDLLVAVDRHPWQTTIDHGVQVYGYGYDNRAKAARPAAPLPVWAVSLAQRLSRDGYAARVPNQLVANAYEPGAGFFDHVDQSVFGNVVLSVTLASSCTMRFTRENRGEAVFLEPRSLLVLTGEARWDWKHGIPAAAGDVWDGVERPRSRRVSLTFRVVPDA